MLLDGEPAVPADDLRQARELASLICSSGEAVETFVAYCDIAARDLLLPYGDVVMALSIVLRIRLIEQSQRLQNTLETFIDEG